MQVSTLSAEVMDKWWATYFAEVERLAKLRYGVTPKEGCGVSSLPISEIKQQKIAMEAIREMAAEKIMAEDKR